MRRRPALLALFLALATPAAASAQTYFAAPTALSGDAYWTNYLRVVDLTGDGRLDVIVANNGGFFTAPQPQPFQVFVGSASAGLTNQTASVLGAFDKAVRQFALGDVDGDGDLDLYVPDAGGIAQDLLFINQGGGKLVDEASTRLPGASSTAGATRFGDFDGDGDLDLIVLNGYAGSAPDGAKLYFNDGTGSFVESGAALPAITGGSDPDDVDLADFDRDFDLDVFVNLHVGQSRLWINDGTGAFTDASTALPAFGSGFHYGPAVCDVDGDGDLDLWVDNVQAPYAEMLLINDGTGTFVNETATRVSGNPQSADDNGVACVDVDGDGDMDAAIMSLTGNERILFNDGTGSFVHVGGFPTVADPTLWFDFGDLNDDGRLDCVTGQGENNPKTNLVYLGSSQAPVDTTPPKISINQKPSDGGDGVARFAVSDSVAGDDGPHLKRAFVRVTQPAPAEHDARFVGGDLFRAVITGTTAGSTVVYRACAVDRANNEGCGDEQSFVSGMSGAGGAAGSAGTAGAGGSSGGSGGAGATSSGGASGGGASGQGGAAGAPASGGGSSDGCGCRLGSRGSPWGSLALLLLAISALSARAAARARAARARRSLGS